MCEYHHYLLNDSVCYKCDLIIIGRFVSAIGKKFHVNCFHCSFCRKLLTDSTIGTYGYKQNGSKAYCVDCYIKLF